MVSNRPEAASVWTKFFFAAQRVASARSALPLGTATVADADAVKALVVANRIFSGRVECMLSPARSRGNGCWTTGSEGRPTCINMGYCSAFVNGRCLDKWQFWCILLVGNLGAIRARLSSDGEGRALETQR